MPVPDAMTVVPPSVQPLSDAADTQLGCLDLAVRIERSVLLAEGMIALMACTWAARHAPTPPLWIWLGAWGALAIVRLLWSQRYLRAPAGRSVSERWQEIRRHGSVWVASAACWGLLPLAVWGRDDAATAWLAVAAAGAMSMVWTSLHRATHRRVMGTLMGVAAGSALVGSLVFPGAAGLDGASLRWLAMTLLFWAALLPMASLLQRAALQRIEQEVNRDERVSAVQRRTQAAEEAIALHRRQMAEVVHDLKQPLGALGIYAEWLRDERDLAGELGPKILQTTRALEGMFDVLLDLARTETASPTAGGQPVDVRQMLAELQTQFLPQARQKGLALRMRPLDSTADADPVVLRRILSNLLSNAIRYTSRGGVLLAARRRGEDIIFEVWDTGAGIAQEEQARVFEDFYRGRAAEQDEQGGLGLGLAIVRRLVDQAGYPLRLHSRPGHGTLFRLRVGAPAGTAGQPDDATGSAGHSSARNAGSASGF